MKWQKKEVRTSETSEATKRTRNQLARSPSFLLHPAMHSLGNSEGASGPTGLARRKEFLPALSPSHGRFMVFAQETVARVRCQNERTCEQGKVRRRRRRRPSAASTKSGQSPTDLPNPNFVPFRDPDERYRRRRDDAKYVWCCCCVLLMGSGEGIGAGEEEEEIYFMGGVINVVT